MALWWHCDDTVVSMVVTVFVVLALWEVVVALWEVVVALRSLW